MRKAKAIFDQTAGAEVAEAALVLPIFFLLLIGIFWLGRVYNVYATINYAARQGARVAASRSCASCGDANKPGNSGYSNDAAPVVDAISQVLQAANLDINQAKAISPPAYCACGGSCSTTVSCAKVGGSSSPNVCVQFNVQLNPSNGAAGCGVSVTFQYPYNVPLPFVSVNSITLTSQAQTVGEF